MNIEELKAIVAGKPEGATHVSDNGVYYFMNYSIAMNYWVRGEEWVESGGVHHLTRSLSDIEKLIAQADEIAELREMIKSFMATNEDLNEWRFEMESTISELLAKGESNG